MEALPKKSDFGNLIKSPTFLIKILELVLTSLAVTLFMAVTTRIVAVKAKWAIMSGTLIGFIMISVITIVGGVLKTPLHRTLILIALLFFAAGGIILEAFHNASNSTAYLISSGIVAFFNGFVYCGDFALTFYKYK
jgi:FtsH-binding integral membrane protein